MQKTFSFISQGANQLVSFIGSVFSGLSAAILYVWSGISAITLFVWSGMYDVISYVFTGIRSLAVSFWEYVGPTAVTAVGVVSTAIRSMGRFITTTFTQVSAIASAIWKFITPIALQAINIISTAIKQVYAVAQWVFMGVWTVVSYVFNQVYSFIMYVFEGIYAVVVAVWPSIYSVISAVWTAISGEALLTFDSIQRFILTMMIGAEFAFNNVGRIAEVMWVNLEYGAARTFNQIIYFLTEMVPAAASWFADNFQNIFVTLSSNALTLIENLGTNIVAVFTNLPGLIAGTTDFSQILTPLTDGLINTIEKMPEIPERVLGDVEQQLKAQADSLNQALGNDFNAFHAQRMGELMPKDTTLENPLLEDMGKNVAEAAAAADRVAYDAGKDLGKGLGKGIKAASPFDAAIAGSKEAADHIATYLMGATRQSSATMTPVQKQTNEVKKSNDHLVGIKTGIETLIGITREALQSEPVILSPANIA